MHADFDHYHLIGIGGIGMSALARILLQRGNTVSGSDQRASPLVEKLRGLGARISIPHDSRLFLAFDQKRTCIAFSTAISPENLEFASAKAHGFSLLHRSELLALLAEQKVTYGVTGSHGKTTTSALLAQVLGEEGTGLSFALGGLLQPLESNGQWHARGPMVVEIDESDGKSLSLPLLGGILTNVSYEHMNFWCTPERLFQAFSHWAHSIEDPNLFVWCADDPRCCQIAGGRGWGYGSSSHADFRLDGLRTEGAHLRFDLHLPGKERYVDLELPLRGQHNALNACGVIALCSLLGISEGSIRRALSAFQGVARRCQLRGTWSVHSKEILIFDDYAHHPKEICATLTGLRASSKAQRLIAIFQPHRYSRLRDCFKEYQGAFDAADEIWICPVYAAGESPEMGVDSQALISALHSRGIETARLWTQESWEAQPLDRLGEGAVICAMGAGDVMDVTADVARLL